ncbi:hypothetical protein ACFYOB_19185, partial [Streptomyces sp. NPDC006463]
MDLAGASMPLGLRDRKRGSLRLPGPGRGPGRGRTARRTRRPVLQNRYRPPEKAPDGRGGLETVQGRGRGLRLPDPTEALVADPLPAVPAVRSCRTATARPRRPPTGAAAWRPSRGRGRGLRLPDRSLQNRYRPPEKGPRPARRPGG